MRGRRRSSPRRSAARSSGSTARSGDSAAGSTWRGTGSASASTSTSRRRFPGPSRRFATHAYPHLAAIANRWESALGAPGRYPADLAAFLRICAEQGQTKPTPLLLRYKSGGYNCLHQDLYGAVAFPLQMTWALSRRGVDFEGGESLLVEQRPRAQSRGEVIALEQGEALIFPTHHRPVRGASGYHRVAMRHGVSRIHSGERYTLGVIFHDAA